jgi:ribosome-binding protein aMBF1 (putative translation factor)
MARGNDTPNNGTGARRRDKNAVSPIGTPISEATARRVRQNRAYAAEKERIAPYEQIARIVIGRRMDLGLTQKDVAERMGTSHSAISRIESGRHPTRQETLARLAQALDMRYVHGFEIEGAQKPKRKLVEVA